MSNIITEILLINNYERYFTLQIILQFELNNYTFMDFFCCKYGIVKEPLK